MVFCALASATRCRLSFRGVSSPTRSTLAELGEEVSEEEQQEGGGGEGELLALQVAGAAGGHAREQRHAQGKAAEKAADMSFVVDADDAGEVGAEADDQVQHGELDDGATETAALEGGDGEVLVGGEDGEGGGGA